MKTILIADDEKEIRDLLVSALDDPEWTFSQVADGEKALETLMFQKADLLITDLNMPKLTGVDLVRYLQSIAQPVPVIIFSGRLDKSVIKQLQVFGVIDFIEKPADFNKIKDLLRRRLSGIAKAVSSAPELKIA